MITQEETKSKEPQSKDYPFLWLVTTKHGVMVIFCFVFSLLVSFVIYEKTIGLKGLNWTETEGVVVERKLQGEKGKLATANIRYSYDVGELNYVKSYHSQFDGFAYKVGDNLKVLYNPADTNQSRLDLGFSLDILALALIDLVFVIVMIWAVLRQFKEQQRQPVEGFEDFEPYYQIESSN